MLMTHLTQSTKWVIAHDEAYVDRNHLIPIQIRRNKGFERTIEQREIREKRDRVMRTSIDTFWDPTNNIGILAQES